SQDTTAVLLLIGAFLACTALFFGILQLDFDVGRDFLVADQMLRGKLPYRDTFYFYGPLTPWFHWLLFRLCGPSLLSLLVAGALAGFLVVLLVYGIARQILLPTPAAVAGLLVTVRSVYGVDVARYATPYTFSATYGLLFALLTLYAALRSLDAPSISRWDLVAASSAGLALATKQEYAIISAVVLGAALVLRFYRSPRRLLPAVAVGAACYGLFAAPFAFLVLRQISLAQFLANVYPKDSLAGWRHFLELAGGWGPYFWPEIQVSIAGFLYNVSFVLWGACLLPLLMAWFRDRRTPAPVFWLLLAEGLVFVWRFPSFLYYPLLLHMVVLAFVVTGRAPGSRAKTGLLAFAAAVFLFRIPNARYDLYGQFYCVPSLIVYLYLWYELAAPRLARLFPERRVHAAITAVFLLAALAPEFFTSEFRWARHTQAMASERGQFRIFAPEAVKARVVLAQIRRYTDLGDKILLLPFGTMYYFLTGRQPPSRYLDYTNGQLVDGAPEQVEIRRLSQGPPKLVVIDDFADVAEFAGPVNTFGRAYNVQLARWIHENYQEVRSIPYQGRLVHFLIPKGALPAASRAPAGKPAKPEG
ncbi:MAG TPA: glycosyltransferase family 39 protein, partial [Bryobacterales bacterium]|nr:glycosyltransferase family 39 protein [Bryobacterales bacterium]